MKCPDKKYMIISIAVSVLFIVMFFGIYFPFEFLVRYSIIINIIFIAILLFIMKLFHDKKCLITFITIFILSIVFFFAYINGAFAPFIEKAIGETPEAKVELYLQTASKKDKKAALGLWEFPNWWNSTFAGFDQLKERREKITNELIEAKINSHFTITKIDWWNTCCMPSITDDSNLANGARVYVQLTDFNNNKLDYIFDVFVSKGHREPGIGDSIRHWTIRDIYPENEEPLFWARK